MDGSDYQPASNARMYLALGILVMVVGLIPTMVFVFNPDLPIALGAAALMEALGVALVVMSRNPSVGNPRQETFSVEARGLRREGKEGSSLVAWDQIEGVYIFKSALSSLSTCRVVTRSGETILVDKQIKGHMELADKISQRVTEALLPAAKRNLLDGREIVFGDLRISRSEVSHKGKRIPWSRVGTAGIGYDHRYKTDVFEATEKGHDTVAIRAVLYELPNVEVFREIFGQASLMHGLGRAGVPV